MGYVKEMNKNNYLHSFNTLMKLKLKLNKLK